MARNTRDNNMEQIRKIAAAAQIHRDMRLRQKMQTQRLPGIHVQGTINAARGGAPTGKPKLKKAPMAGTAEHKSIQPKIPTLTPIPALPSLGQQAPPPPTQAPGGSQIVAPQPVGPLNPVIPKTAPGTPGTPGATPAPKPLSKAAQRRAQQALSIEQQPTQPQVSPGQIPLRKTQPLLGAYGPQQAQLKVAAKAEKPVPKVQQYMVDAEEKARARKRDEVAKLTAIEQLARSAEGIPQDTTAFLGGLPAPGGIALPLLLLIVLFLLVIPAKGSDGKIHTRAMWLWRVMTGNASLALTAGDQAATQSGGVSGIPGVTTFGNLQTLEQIGVNTLQTMTPYPLGELGLVP